MVDDTGVPKPRDTNVLTTLPQNDKEAFDDMHMSGEKKSLDDEDSEKVDSNKDDIGMLSRLCTVYRD